MQWIVVDAKVYDISKFKNFHPGGASVLLDAEVGATATPYTSWGFSTPPIIFTHVGTFTAGQDATEAFYGLHRHEVLDKPQYKRLQIGVIADEKSVIHGKVVGELSKVPYAEPTWLSKGYHSPYYSEVRFLSSPSYQILTLFLQNHRAFQRAVRKFMDEIVAPDAVAREEDGKPPSASVVEAMA